MNYVLTIHSGQTRRITHSTLRDARADLVGYQHRHGYWLTTGRWVPGYGQTGELRQNGTVVAEWTITPL